MRAVLVPLDGGNSIEIQKDLLLVGRQVNCDLRIEHKTISKLHCILVKTDGLLLIRDLGSTNGCRVNGQRIKRAALLPNDVLSIAGFKYKVMLGPDGGNEPEPRASNRNDVTEVIDKQSLASSIQKSLSSPLLQRRQKIDVSVSDSPPH